MSVDRNAAAELPTVSAADYKPILLPHHGQRSTAVSLEEYQAFLDAYGSAFGARMAHHWVSRQRGSAPACSIWQAARCSVSAGR